jgi:hypothetical protein
MARTAKDACKVATSFYKEFYDPQDMRLEEVSYDSKDQAWFVVLSFASQLGEHRSHKRFHIVEKNGTLEVTSMFECPPLATD